MLSYSLRIIDLQTETFSVSFPKSKSSVFSKGVTSLNYKIFFSNVTQLTDAVVSFDLLECHFKKENVRTMTSRAKN